MLGYSSVKDLRVTKVVIKRKFQQVCGELESNGFPEITIHKIFQTKSSFPIK